MIPALTAIIAAYVITRMLELAANENARGDGGRTHLQVAAVITLLIAFGSCTAVQMSGSSVQMR